MNPFTDRKASYKQPPRSLLDRALSQESRRNKALEEQKRRRAKRIESERHIDLFADLKLGHSDDDAGDDGAEPEIVREGIGQLASLLQQPGPSSDAIAADSDATAMSTDALPTTFGPKRRGKRKKPKAASKKTSPWAEKLMYAELLEMPEGDPWAATPDLHVDAEEPLDGLPQDLQTGWVAVAPVPVGKRCLAISHQGSGTIGVVPNTTLRSRLLGKPLMPRFPSPLPSDTILDCILDQNWADTGILHVLDVLKWKGQDVADCESSFRFWWRDTRLSELPPPRPPTHSAQPQPSDPSPSATYRFPYPTTFYPVSYHTNTTLGNLLNTVIPLARATYYLPIFLPTVSVAPMALNDEAATMDVEQLDESSVEPSRAEIKSDGLLLYVAQAIYEPGTSPLSSWVPCKSPCDRDGVQIEEGLASPLDKFESLVRQRLSRQVKAGVTSDEAMHL